jgi:hypothetical protein
LLEKDTEYLQRTKLCGCKARHGHSRSQRSRAAAKQTATYRSWLSMRMRCLQKSSNAYHRYGGRGITICRRWDDFETFLADMGERPLGHTLERNDNDGNYEPGNCRWASSKEQGRNRSNVRLFTLNGRTLCLKDWADESGINYASLRWRVTRNGWPLEEALNWKKGKMRAKRRERARNEKGQWAPD